MKHTGGPFSLLTLSFAVQPLLHKTIASPFFTVTQYRCILRSGSRTSPEDGAKQL